MAQAQDHYTELFPLFSQISSDQFTKPFGSVEAILSYCDGVVALIANHGNRLIEEGADVLILDSLGKRADAYAVAEMNSRTAIVSQPQSGERWASLKAEAIALKADIILYAEVAFENSSALLEKLQDIISGQGNDDLIQDMLALSKLCAEQSELFAPFKKFDPAWLIRAEELFTELRETRALLDNGDEHLASLVILEKQAFSYLAIALDEIRRFGRLAFRNEPELWNVLKLTHRV